MNYHPETAIHSNKNYPLPTENKNVSLLHNGQKRLKDKEYLLQTLVENSFDLLGLIDETGKYIYVAESVHNASRGKKDSLLGYQASDFIGKNSFQFFHPDDLPPLMERFGLLFKGQKKIHVPPYRFLDASGNWRWMEAIVTNQLNNPEIQAIVVSCRDVSHQVETEIKLKNLLALEALLEGEEKERSRIARDLHDSVANIIAAVKMQLAALDERVQQTEAKSEFSKIFNLLDHAAVQVRNTSHNLMPELLLENGLDGALQHYCQSISNKKISFDYVCIGTVRRFSETFELSIYRTAQELIGNIIKHSNADTALIQLCFRENLLTLTIEDNGKGFNYKKPTKGTGLKAVQKKVKAMDGNLELYSEPGKGTSIYIEFEK